MRTPLLTVVLFTVMLCWACGPGRRTKQSQLPKPTVDVVAVSLDEAKPVEGGVQAEGWVVLRGKESAGSRVSGVLLAGYDAYVFPAEQLPRPDVTSAFRQQGEKVNLDQSGYRVLFQRVPKGEYPFAVLVRAADGTEGMGLTDKMISIP